ncbi:MAG TPA: thioredoxin [Hymenobacter sp.]|uniref:thioredoxin n=1 Tax=Hymenobacter sp. TaxID=1898978 RepID=UPI002D7E90D2|nr:thioredoxin [Hymenobacter sp.]HET9503071.1 thioredoxin [Hymenobacter sp.]
MPCLSPTPDPAVLLVLLPPAAGEDPGEAGPAATLRGLRQRLGPAVRVLSIDEASHPAVVRSFGPPELPACVLMRQGVELWRQPGLPSAEALLATLAAAAPPG